MNIRAKIISSFFLLGIVISGTTVFLTLGVMKKQTKLGDFHLKTLNLIQDISFTSLEIIEEGFAYLVSGDTAELVDFRNGRVSLWEMFAEFKEMAHVEETEELAEKVLYESIVSNAEMMFIIAESLFKEYELKGDIGLNAFYTFEESVDKYISSLKLMIKIEQDEVEEAATDAIETISSFTRVMFVISAIALLFAIAIGYSVSSSISTPLARLAKASSQIAEGNYIELDIKSDDEFGVLSESFSKMATNIKRSREETEAARDRVDGILKSIADGLIATDLNGRVVLMNKAAEDLLDVRFGDVLDKPIEFAIKDETLRDRVKPTLEKGTTGYSFDFEWAGENDSPDIFRARTSIVFDKRGEQTGVITLFHNVTHEREIDRMKSEFISMAAHELRTPLTSIKGYSEILLSRDNLNQSDRTKFLTYIQDQSEVLSKIISDLLDISRIESGKGFELQKESCRIGDIIEQIAESYTDRFPIDSIRVHLPKREVEVFLDKEKMVQVLENLLSNAVKYSPEEVDIDITGEVQGKVFHIIIQDKGIGMTPEQLKKVYERFYRADTSNTGIAGTGLGLSIAKAIVEAHEGEMWIESTPGMGTRVSFSVPMQNSAGSVKEADETIGNS